MPETTGPTYENHLKGVYSVKTGEKTLAITDTSCYNLPEATAWLTANLPGAGAKNEYLASLSALGLAEPEKIFEKLMAIGALQVKPERSWKSILKAIFSPKIRLLSAQWQARVLALLRVGPEGLRRASVLFLWPALLGAFWGLWLLAGGGDKLLPAAAGGKASGAAVLVLVVVSSLVHELGHSFAAAASGIGLRPIGFSVYLIYPVFYTNVSGIEKLGLKAKAFVDTGGFLLQSVFILGLLLFSAVTGSASAAEAVRWIMAMVLFNLNPFLRTDGYWLYKDTYSELKRNRWMRAVHYFYLLAFLLFSIYFLRFLFVRLGNIWGDLARLAQEPSYFFSGGYRVVLGAYFVFVGLSGGLLRFREGHDEWKELVGLSKGAA